MTTFHRKLLGLKLYSVCLSLSIALLQWFSKCGPWTPSGWKNWYLGVHQLTKESQSDEQFEHMSTLKQ